MNEILDFLVNHWQLSLAFILVVGAYLVYEYVAGEDSTSISPEHVVDMINHEQGVIVDVRSSNDFATGHVLNAINIAMDAPAGKFKQLNKYANKPVIIVCATGKTAAQAMKHAQEQGCARVYILAGGMQAWRAAGLPLINKK